MLYKRNMHARHPLRQTSAYYVDFSCRDLKHRSYGRKNAIGNPSNLTAPSNITAQISHPLLSFVINHHHCHKTIVTIFSSYVAHGGFTDGLILHFATALNFIHVISAGYIDKVSINKRHASC